MRSIIVIGHARSGTSLTSGVLHKLGVNMGNHNQWRPADEANEKGYFENTNFVTANKDILEKGIIDKKRLKEIVKNSESELWGCKDPRFLETWEYWEPYIKNPHFVVCLRDHGAVTNSICYRDDGKYSRRKKYPKVKEDVINYYDRVYEFLDNSDYPHTYVRYEEYFKEKKDPVRQLSEFLEIPYKKVGLPDKSLKHF